MMKAVLRFLTGLSKNAVNIALTEATVGNRVQDLARQERGWKLFLLLPRLLLHCRPWGGVSSRDKLQFRFAKFARGEWLELLQVWNNQPQLTTAINTIVNMIWSDAPTGHSSWFSLVSSLQRAEIVPGNDDTLHSLEDPTRRFPTARDPILEDMVNFRLVVEFSLDEALFARTLRFVWTGGPSGMSHEHLRPLGHFKRFATSPSVGGAFCPC